ncbi:hypothetical protein EZS27_010183 [termite gut metagenome]|uniref:Uncharacterized protein n=1 Tax=termite gut metagenome TaxID=433724 RepID=A0A5J4S7J7_9ZZZZ
MNVETILIKSRFRLRLSGLIEELGNVYINTNISYYFIIGNIFHMTKSLQYSRSHVISVYGIFTLILIHV